MLPLWLLLISLPLFSWFLLLPCRALALPLRIIHSLSCACLTLTAAQRVHIHTCLQFRDTVSYTLPLTHTQCPCHYTRVHTCTPTHIESYSSLGPHPSSYLAAEDRVMLWMLSPLVTTPHSSQRLLLMGDCWRHLSHMCEHKHTPLTGHREYQLGLPSHSQVCEVRGVSCMLSVCVCSIHP